MKYDTQLVGRHYFYREQFYMIFEPETPLNQEVVYKGRGKIPNTGIAFFYHHHNCFKCQQMVEKRLDRELERVA